MLVYFEMGVPSFWPEKETLDDGDSMLTWVQQTQDSDHIEGQSKTSWKVEFIIFIGLGAVFQAGQMTTFHPDNIL